MNVYADAVQKEKNEYDGLADRVQNLLTAEQDVGIYVMPGVEAFEFDSDEEAIEMGSDEEMM